MHSAEEPSNGEGSPIIPLLFRLCHRDAEQGKSRDNSRNIKANAKRHTKQNAKQDHPARAPYSVEAYFCHQETLHFFSPGPAERRVLCGYQNIRVALSFLHRSRLWHSHKIQTASYRIRDLQNYIEVGWNEDINWYRSRGLHSKFEGPRQELHPLVNSTKPIGADEVEALYSYFDIPNVRETYESNHKRKNKAADGLFDALWHHFSRRYNIAKQRELHAITENAPIYLQMDGHSVTIIGIEKMSDGTWNLLIFDPDHPSSAHHLHTLLQSGAAGQDYPAILAPYRLTKRQLSKQNRLQTIM
jgi:zinc finger-containing ubiquitin peptidase 1